MKKIIEFFKWDYEGEFQQYHYVIEEEKENDFINEVLNYLNNVHTKDEYPWADCLTEFKYEDRITLPFKITDGYLEHLGEYYYINEQGGYKDGFTFTLNKITFIKKEEEYKL